MFAVLQYYLPIQCIFSISFNVTRLTKLISDIVNGLTWEQYSNPDTKYHKYLFKKEDACHILTVLKDRIVHGILHLAHSSSVNIISLYGIFEVIWGQNAIEYIPMEFVLFQGQFHHENRDCFMFPRRRTRTGYRSNQETKVQHIYI